MQPLLIDSLNKRREVLALHGKILFKDEMYLMPLWLHFSSSEI